MVQPASVLLSVPHTPNCEGCAVCSLLLCRVLQPTVTFLQAWVKWQMKLIRVMCAVVSVYEPSNVLVVKVLQGSLAV